MRAHRLSTTTAFRLAFGLLLLGSGLLHPGSRGLAQTSEPDSVFEATGFQKNRAYFSQLPFENIDMVSGNLVLTFTDLVLPGNAGMDLRFQRTYNLNGDPTWSFGLAGIPLRIRNPDGPTHCDDNPPLPGILTADGGERKAFPRTPYPKLYPQTCWPLDTVFITSDFWRWDRTTRVLQLPNGWTIRYSPTFTISGNSVAYAEEVKDAFDNRITIEWQFAHPKALWKVHQWFGAAERVVEFATTDTAYGFPESMTYDGRTWDYAGGRQRPLVGRSPSGPGLDFRLQRRIEGDDTRWWRDPLPVQGASVPPASTTRPSG